MEYKFLCVTELPSYNRFSATEDIANVMQSVLNCHHDVFEEDAFNILSGLSQS